MKYKKSTVFVFVGPAIILFLVFFCYPIIRTFIMSFFRVDNIGSKTSSWVFTGLGNFKSLLSSNFVNSLITLGKIWLFCGAAVCIIALFFATSLTSGIKLKGFFRSMLYLPNVIPQLAIGYMWTLYVFSGRFGLFKKLFTALGMPALAEFGWTSPDNIFLSMCIAYVFSNVGYFVLMYMAAIEAIPKDLYESAMMDGASSFTKFFKITVPLISSTLVSSLTIWTSRVCAFFALSRVFESASTTSPLMYIYNVCFSAESSYSEAGLGAAGSVVLTFFVVIVFLLSSRIPKTKDIET